MQGDRAEDRTPSAAHKQPSIDMSGLRIGGLGELAAGRGNAAAAEELSVQEQEILASIQELQRQLWEAKAEHDRPENEPRDDTDKHRVIVVSNRLPITAAKDAQGNWMFSMSTGGLVTALNGTRDELNFVWIGWFGAEVAKEDEPVIRRKLWEEHSCVPVFLPDDIADKHYNGFSNNVLWPLFHYVPLPMYKPGSEKKFDNSLWEAYKTANAVFADVVATVYQPGDYVWVHDYHLMRLPYELRRRFPDIPVGWFLHTPFPSSEIYRILPVKKELLEGVVCADLVGFHTYDYARHFLNACSRVLEVDSTPRGLEYQNHFMALGVYPIGIDHDHITNMLTVPFVKNRISELAERFKGRKVLLGVDRLDYIKGMPHKLLAYELFLTRHPEWRGKVTLIQVGVPSRTEVEEYKNLAGHVNELVGRINGNFGTLEYSPIHYINQSIEQEELVAIYNLAEVCLVTSVRDGMNLVSHEYVAAQSYFPVPVEGHSGPGVLVLSEFTGSAQSLSGAIRVNPWNTEELANAIHQALTMSRVERELRQHKLYRYVSTNTAAYWARRFMSEFREVCSDRPKLSRLPLLPVSSVLREYQSSKNRLIVSDYDGTLTQLQSLPQLASPSPQVLSLLEQLSADPRNTIIIMSGREKRFMEMWFGRLRVGLAAEHGFFYRLPGEQQWHSAESDVDLSWKDVVLPIMQYFTDRTPGTYIEDKEISLTWHYRDADPHFGVWQAKDMQIHMEDVLATLPIDIWQGNNMVEVRYRNASKASVVDEVYRWFRDQIASGELSKVDFVLSIGDDRSDEEVFSTMKHWKEVAVAYASGHNPGPSSPTGSVDGSEDHRSPDEVPILTPDAAVHTVHIGSDVSGAEYALHSPEQLRALLRDMARVSALQTRAMPPPSS